MYEELFDTLVVPVSLCEWYIHTYLGTYGRNTPLFLFFFFFFYIYKYKKKNKKRLCLRERMASVARGKHCPVTKSPEQI